MRRAAFVAGAVLTALLLLSALLSLAWTPWPPEQIDMARRLAPPSLAHACRCGDIMAGIATPKHCTLFGKECVPDTPVGACMVSSEGTCKIWYQYGGQLQLGSGA